VHPERSSGESSLKAKVRANARVAQSRSATNQNIVPAELSTVNKSYAFVNGLPGSLGVSSDVVPTYGNLRAWLLLAKLGLS